MNAVAPGIILSNGMNNYPEGVLEIVSKETHFQNPSCRLGVEEEISSVVTFLLTPASAYVTGTTFRVDGGASLLKSYGSEVFQQESKMPVFVSFRR